MPNLTLIILLHHALEHSPISVIGEHTFLRHITLHRSYKSITYLTIGHGKSSTSRCLHSVLLAVIASLYPTPRRPFPPPVGLLTCLMDSLQVPESYQESTRRAAHATEPRLRVQSDRGPCTPGPDAAYPGIRYVQVGCKAVGLLSLSVFPGCEEMALDICASTVD